MSVPETSDIPQWRVALADGAIVGALLAETLGDHPELVRNAIKHLERNAHHAGAEHYALAVEKLKGYLAIYESDVVG